VDGSGLGGGSLDEGCRARCGALGCVSR
jgi:hypothetical protein